MKGPTRMEDPPQKVVARIEYEPKLCKTKRITISKVGSGPNKDAVTFDEAKASCKARKRKERQESVSSLCQEKKVIRSSSEERPVLKMCLENKSNIRRVSSSGDFPKSDSTSLEKCHGSPNKSQYGEKTFVYEDYEHEKRRSHERFARPFPFKNKRLPHKRLKVRYMSKSKFKPDIAVPDSTRKGLDQQELDDLSKKQTNFLQLHVEERVRSPSPVNTPVSPMLDFSTLHEQVDCSEPLISCSAQQLAENIETLPSLSVASNRLLSSPRNSIIATHRIYLDKDVPQTTSALDKIPQNPIDQRTQKLAKQINSLKKKIKQFESEFENRNGYKPSHADKMNDKTMKKLYGDLNKYRKEQKQLAEMSNTCVLVDKSKSDKCSTGKTLQETLKEMDQKLLQKRESAQRCYEIEQMSAEQLSEEKVAIQKALLYLESVHGRPNTKEDRNLVRPFYDRYRVLKRLVAKTTTTNLGGTELATINENETMNFVTPNSSSNETESEITDDTKTNTHQLPAVASNTSSDADNNSQETSLSENLMALSKQELLKQLKVVQEEKKELRRSIKEFEMNLTLTTGKMPQKEDKTPMDSLYLTYKKTKAKVRLLEALLGKQ